MPHREKPAEDDDTDDGLLNDVQKYFKLLLERVAPDSVLTAQWNVFQPRYQRIIRQFVIRCHVPSSEVADCVQDIWSQVYLKLPEFRHNGHRGALRAWLLKLIRHHAIDQTRSRARRGESVPLEDVSNTSIEPCDAHADPAAEFERVWEQTLLRSVAEELSLEIEGRSQFVLTMRLIEGRSFEQIAVALGLSPKNVWDRWGRLQEMVKIRMNFYLGKDYTDDIAMPEKV